MKMKISHGKTCKFAEKKRKTCKMRNTHSRTWNMARKLTNKENETLPW
jgi:hypothetical protein